MQARWNRRDVLKGLAAASTMAMVKPSKVVASAADVELQITNVSAHTFRLSLLAVRDGTVAAPDSDGSLVKENWGKQWLGCGQGKQKTSTWAMRGWRLRLSR